MSLLKIYLFMGCLLAVISVSAQQMNLNWLQRSGGSAWDMATDMTVNDSTIVVTGTFSDFIVFGADTLRSVGDRDIFIARYDTEGNYLNSFRIGTIGFDYSFKILFDESSNLIIAMKVNHSLLINNQIINSIGKYNFIIANLTTEGVLLSHSVFATSERSSITDLCMAPDGDIYFTGNFNGTLAIGNNNYISTEQDIFLGKVSKKGQLKWLKVWGGDDDDKSFNILKTKNNMILLSGSTYHGCMGSAFAIPVFVERKNYLFVAEINEGGNVVDVTYPFYGPDFSTKGIAVTDTSLWISVTFKYDITTPGRLFESKGESDILLMSSLLDDFDFSYQHIGGKGSDIPVQIANTGNYLVLSGMYSDTLMLGDNRLIPEKAGKDIFVTTINPKLEFEQLFTLSGNNYNYSSVIKTTSSGIFVAGEFKGTMGDNDLVISSKGEEDVFVARYENCSAKNPLRINIDSTQYAYDKYVYSIDAGEGFVNYLWNDNSETRVLSTKKDGLYFVEVEDRFGCYYVDSVSILKFKSVFLTDHSLKTGNLKFYPTLTTGVVNFIANEQIETRGFTVRVTDLEGKVFYSKKIHGDIDPSRIYQIDLYGLYAATYLVWVISDKGSWSGKIVLY